MSDSTFVFSSYKGHTELPLAEEVDLVSITIKVLRLRDGSNGEKLPAVVLNSHLQTSVCAVIKLCRNYSNIVALKALQDGVPELFETIKEHLYVAHSE